LPKNQWSHILEQLGIIGKYLVNNDKENIGSFSNVHDWHLGSIMWGLSEHLSLLNLFLPKKKKTNNLTKARQAHLQRLKELRDKDMKNRRRFMVIS